MDAFNLLEDIVDTYGSVPGNFETTPDDVLEREWRPFKEMMSFRQYNC